MLIKSAEQSRHSERSSLMKELKLFVALSVALFIAVLFAGCGGKAATPKAATGSTAPGSISPPPNSNTISDIQKLGGWENCTAGCTSTPLAVFSMTQGVVSPSQSGASARFQLLAGTQPFGGALWFKFLGTFNSATHFVYDLSFYMDNPSAAQALEFNVSQ